ncbi:hypothetical protein [Helicobacter pullorum]|uniref:hypothetical protein n=1 Tax=Helicobacter pullorum TaxID=35818 RepID=UPI000E0F72C6|nr:hypothetical protein [Helicobacter pullorum]
MNQHVQLNNQKKARFLRIELIHLTIQVAKPFIHLAKWIENYTVVRSESEYSLEKILSGFIVEFL